jgi:hypothetical protein
MERSVGNDVLRLIRAEKDRRQALLTDEQPEIAFEHWWSVDEPFLNELCLMLLVARRHQVEKELVHFAARVTADGTAIDRKLYPKKVKAERDRIRKCGWKGVIAKLKLSSSTEWDSSMKTLQLLANCYKHDPSGKPDEELLEHLKLDKKLHYMSLAESPKFRAGLALSVGLPGDADYCEIAEEFLSLADQFLGHVQKGLVLSPFKGRRPSFRDMFGC